MTTDPQSQTPALPHWLEELLPEPQEPHVLSTLTVDGERILRVTAPSGESSDFSTVGEVAKIKALESQDLTIEAEVYEHFSDGEPRGFGLRYDSETPGFVGILMAYDDSRRRRALERDYAQSLEDRRLYLENPRDFVAAWRFIDSHPAFWTTPDLENYPWYWETSGYCSKLRQYVHSVEGGGVSLELAGGGHVEHATSPKSSAYSEHYADWRLEVQADSFESAILELAFRVSKAFDAEGNSLPEADFPYEVPEWMETLRERAQKLD